MSFRDYMISVVRQHQYYEDGAFEAMTDTEVRDIYENVIDWIG